MNKSVFITTVFSLCLLSACSAEQESVDAPSPAAAEMPAPAAQAPVDQMAETAPTDSVETFDTENSVRTLMNTLVQPNADRIWQAVRYVVTEEGVTEDVRPQTDEDWARLHQSAIALVEAGNTIMLPGRAMDNMPLEPDYPAFKYRPEEIEALVDADPEGWRYFIQEMQASTRITQETIEKRDILGLIETGARINNACQGCHAEFWYRPNNQ